MKLLLFPASVPALAAFSLPALCLTPASGQVTANDDGSAGSPFDSTDEDSAIVAGPSVTANDSGSFRLLTTDTTSASGTPVTLQDSRSATPGRFSFDPFFSPGAQALGNGETLADTFSYFIQETTSLVPTPGMTNESNPTTGTNSTGWASLPASITPDASAPASFTGVYDYSGTANVSTRGPFEDSGWSTTPMSLEFWVKQDVLENVTLWETGGSGIGSGVYLDNSGTVKWAIKTGTESGRLILDSSATMTAGTWHHIVVTLDTATGTSNLYLDGALVGTVSNAENTDWSGGNGAGLGGVNGDAGGDDNNNSGGNSALNTWRNPFNGQVGLFRFYSAKVLTPSEIQDNIDAANVDLTTSQATVTVEVTGANDVPRGTVDVIRTGVTANAPFTSTRDLSLNDGVPGSGLRNLLAMDIPGLIVSQSPSTGGPPGGGVPERAFDQNFARFTHTDSNNNSVDHRWQVDFGSEVFMDSVILSNRTDCCGERFRDLTVTVADSSGTTIFTSPVLNPDNELEFSGNSGGQLVVDLGGIDGQTLTVTRTPDLTDPSASDGSILSLGEVELFGRADVAGEALLLNYDARFESTDDLWQNVGSARTSLLDWDLGSGVTLNASVTSARSQITSAYEWDGTSDATASFALTRGINDVFGGAVDEAGATFEAWVKLNPADLTQISTIFETGGGTGFGLVVDNGVLKSACELDGGNNDQSTVSYDLQSDPLGALGGLAATEEFFQVASVVLPQGGISLYVNGVLVDQTAGGNGADWDGGDNSGLGHFAGSNHGGFINTAETASGGIYNTYFNGSIAVFRLYRAALDPVDIYEAFRAVDEGTDIDGDALTLEGLVDAGGALVPLNTPLTLPSGAEVTMTDTTGGFVFNPNGSFDFVAPGEVATDSFVYQIDDGNGGKGFASVVVHVTGIRSAVDDGIALAEDQLLTFSANALAGNDQLAGLAPGAYVDLSPGNFGVTWTNRGATGFDLALSGRVERAPALESDFPGIGQALGTGGGTHRDLDAISADDATFEIWFRPEIGQTGQFNVYETGGNGNGYSVVYDADTNEVVATVDGGNDATNFIKARAGGIRTDEFNQVVIVYDRDGGNEVSPGVVEDLLSIYVNNDPQASFDPTIDGTGINTAGLANDWSGIDDGGVAVLNNTSALNENYPGLPGEVAAVRVYDRILTEAEMSQNYESFRAGVTSVNSPSSQGVPIVSNPDGTFSYDASALPDLPAGTSISDSFTYVIENGVGGTSTGTVNLVVYASDDPFNDPPAGSLSRSVAYLPGAPSVGIFPPLVISDPDAALGTTLIPLHTVGEAGNIGLADPGAGGTYVRVNFTPNSTDLDAGSKRVVYEIGGTSNGQGIYLIDGTPFFIAKMNGGNTIAPTGIALDADWSGDDLVLVPLADAPLTADDAQELVLVFTGDSLTWELNGAGSNTQALANLGSRVNWSGDDSLGFGIASNGNGGLSDAAGPFLQNSFTALDGSINLGSLAVLPAEIVTATFTLPLSQGAFTEPTGSSFSDDGVTGTWVASGPLGAVQALLEQVEFLPNGSSPASADVVLIDGGENGSTPVTGTLVFTDNRDRDPLDDLLEFAFGTDPAANDAGPLALDGSVNGTPVVNLDRSGPEATFSAVFVRRDDHGTPGSVNYLVQFSSDLENWSDSTDFPIQVADSTDDPDYEVVQVPFPPTGPEGETPRFFRVTVELVR